MVIQPMNPAMADKLTNQLNTVPADAATVMNAKKEKSHETITAIHGRPLSVQVVKIFGALFCTASPYKMRDAEKMNVFAAEKVDVINTALTMEGRTLTPAR
jgi:hypothetical protein